MISTFWDRLVKTFTCDSLHLSETSSTVGEDCAHNGGRYLKAMKFTISQGSWNLQRSGFHFEKILHL